MPLHTPELFGTETAAEYAAAVTRAATVLTDRVRRVEQPRSGATLDQLRRAVDGVDLDGQPVGLAAALEELSELYLEHAVWFHHPMSTAHLNCPVAIPALAAEVLASAVNTSVDTWDQSTSATLVEQRLIAWTAARIGFPDHDGPPGGVFTSGGTQSNTQALLLAREEALARGARLADLRVLVSDQAHFSVRKAARVLGLGPDDGPDGGSSRGGGVVTVATDLDRRLDPAALDAAIRAIRTAGQVPAAVVATAGTTDLGLIDPLDAVADVCAHHGVPLHVDAAYGCGLLVSPTRRHLIAGLHRADSVTVDFHKSFFQPVACSALLVRDARRLGHVTVHADYLNPRGSSAPNLVDVSLQTTRRFDALKLWTTLRVLGASRIGELFDGVLDLAAQAYHLASARPELEVAARPALSTLLFRYRPAGMGAHDAARLVPQIRSALFADGSLLLASTVLDGEPWLKATFLDPATGPEHVARMLDLVTATGGALQQADALLEAGLALVVEAR